MKTSVKSFRETIDFPEACFASPKRNVKTRNNVSSSNSKVSSTSCGNVKKRDPQKKEITTIKNSLEKQVPNIHGKKSFVESDFTSLRRSSRLNKKTKSTNSSFKSLKDVSARKEAKKADKFFCGFNDSFNEDTSEGTKVENGQHQQLYNVFVENSGNEEKALFINDDEVILEKTEVVTDTNLAPEIEHSEKTKPTCTVIKNAVPDEAETSLDSDLLQLSNWGLPEPVVEAYSSQNITRMFQWQAECLSLENVLKGGNIVYSAPTSAGKTLVAEILMLKKVVETKTKGLMILPYVSVVREKVNCLQKLFEGAGIRVDGYMGTYNPPGGFNAIDIAICTIEKANNLINRLMEDGRINHLGIIVVDELHMVGDPHRGYLLELLLTKLLYTCKKNELNHVQVVGMSATLPNLNVLASWLKADLYRTTFRPVPLQETVKIGNFIYDSKSFNLLRDLQFSEINFPNDADHTIYLAVETIVSGHSVLIFCPSKNWCEKLAESIAREVFNLGKMQSDSEECDQVSKQIGSRLREVLDGDRLKDVLIQLMNCPAGLDHILGSTVPFGVAFHHAGLTFDERDIIESAFRFGIIKFLVATSTLSSGVNLPAKRVIIRSPLFRGSLIDVLAYKQMVGRAGRKGIDTSGESILLCKESERIAAKTLLESDLHPVKSCLVMFGDHSLHSSIKRAILEIIASGVARSYDEIAQYMSCTLLSAAAFAEQHENSDHIAQREIENGVNKCLQFLIENEFIFAGESKNIDAAEKMFQPTRLGQAVLASGFSPDDSLRILKELLLARQCFVLENDLHILYEVIPPYLSDQFGEINWLHFLSIWEQLPESMQRVGTLVGVEEQFIGCRIQGQTRTSKAAHRLAVHQRFYAALALCDLIQEVPLPDVARKYNCTRGILQSLQQTTSTFAGMLTVFCNRLGWCNLELLFAQFQKRVHFGIQQELCDLVRMSSMNGKMARMFYNGGYETVAAVAAADPSEIAFLLNNMAPFESARQSEWSTVGRSLETKHVWISGYQGMNPKEAAHVIVYEARKMIEQELGLSNLQWKVQLKEDKMNDLESHESSCSSQKIDPNAETNSQRRFNNENYTLFLQGNTENNECKKSIADDMVADSFSGIDQNTFYNKINKCNSLKRPSSPESSISCNNDGLGLNYSKKAKLEVSDSSIGEVQFSFLLIESFQDSGSHLSEKCKLDASSHKLIQNDLPNCTEDEQLDGDLEDLFNDEHMLSQAAQMDSIYLSSTFYLKSELCSGYMSSETSKNAATSLNFESPIVMSSTPVDKAFSKGITSPNSLLLAPSDLFTKSQANYFCEQPSFNNNRDSDNSLAKCIKHPKPIKQEMISDVKEALIAPVDACSSATSKDNAECFDEALLNLSDHTERLFPEIFNNTVENNLKLCSKSICDTSSKCKLNLSGNAQESYQHELGTDLTIDLNFNSQFSMCNTAVKTNRQSNADDSTYANYKKSPLLDSNVVCKMSNLSLNLNFKGCLGVSGNLEENVSKNQSYSPTSIVTPVECIVPTPPKLTTLSTSEIKFFSDSLSFSKTCFSVEPQNCKKNMLENEVHTHEAQNCNSLSMMSSFSSVSRGTSLGSAKTIKHDVPVKFAVKEVSDDMFCSFINNWKNVEKFSFCVACEKVAIQHSGIGPKMRASKKPHQFKECSWIFGSDVSVVGLSVFWGNRYSFFIPLRCFCLQGADNPDNLTCSKKMEVIQDVFENHLCKKTVISYDLKAQYKVMSSACGLLLNPSGSTVIQDPSVACWLLNPSKGKQSLYNMASTFLPNELHILENNDCTSGCIGLQIESSVPAKERSSAEAFLVYEIMDKLIVHLQAQKLHKAFSDVEMPVLLCLAKMEQNGIGFDSKLAISYRSNLQNRQRLLLEKAHYLAGRKFNLLSPKDIARVLYKELKLSNSDVTNSPVANKHLAIGVSSHKSRQLPPELKTSKAALERIKHMHPLPEVILDWRKISFCLSQVLIPMLKEKTFCKAVTTDRLHSTCYIYTTTGRVNMHSPNLQFVPRNFDVNHFNEETEEDGSSSEYSCAESELFGISLRDMFISSKGYILLSADYFQLELRLLAHLSRDKKLLSLLNSGNDVFKMIASSWKGISADEVSDNLRQQAKQICYGMIYGIGPKALSQKLAVSVEEAALFMDSFMNTYPQVKIYLKSVIERCREKGYVLTLANRRRYLPSINSDNKVVRGHAERQAINTAIQGSAADVVKSAIIKLEKEMKKAFPKSQSPYTYNNNSGPHCNKSENLVHCGGFLVLQLHDELIFEVFENDLDNATSIIRNTMENCVKLSVKLPVRMKIGYSWGNMKELRF